MAATRSVRGIPAIAPKKTQQYILQRIMSQTVPLLSPPRKSLLHRVRNSYHVISIIGCTTHLQQREKVDEEPEVYVDTRSDTAAALLEQSSVIPVCALGACLSAAFGV